MPSKKRTGPTPVKKPVCPSTVVLVFGGASQAPRPLPPDRMMGFEDPMSSLRPDYGVMVQDAAVFRAVHREGPPCRERGVFGVVFVFPDDPAAQGQFDPNFTCRTLPSLVHYIMHNYCWPPAVKARFPDGLVRFASLCILDPNNVVVTDPIFDTLLFSIARLAMPPRLRPHVIFTCVCYRFEKRRSDVLLVETRPVPHGTERFTHTFVVEHQTFLQLLYGLYRGVSLEDRFHARRDVVRIHEPLLDGTTHEVTAATYGTRIYVPGLQLRVELRLASD